MTRYLKSREENDSRQIIFEGEKFAMEAPGCVLSAGSTPARCAVATANTGLCPLFARLYNERSQCSSKLHQREKPVNDNAIKALRDALALSPDNVPLRQHLGDTLMALARYAEAAQEYRQALALAPDNAGLKLGLAKAFLQDGKNSQALVLVEDLLKRRDTPAETHVLHAKLLIRAGEIERAVREYREALKIDPDAADADLAAQLGIGPEH